MIAALDVMVEGDRVVRLAAGPPLAAKVLAGATGPELLLVGAAASLLEGDHLRVSLRLGPGARLTVRTAAATLAHPCPGGGVTSFDVEADVGPQARLAWLPAPLVAYAGCRHTARARVRLAAGAMAVWAETVVLGRSGEEPGELGVRLDVDLNGHPLLRDGLRAGPTAPGWAGPAVLDGARHVASVALLGRSAPLALDGMWPPADGGVTLLPLAGPGLLARALGPCGASVERVVAPVRAALVAELGAFADALVP